jgi:hypothetical protein
MKKTINKTNVNGVSTSYPYGGVKDNTGPNDGTPVNEELIGDYVQFFEKMFSMSGLAANGNPDNSTNHFQLVQALFSVLPKKYVKQFSFGAGDGVTVVVTGAEILAAFGGDVSGGGFGDSHKGFLGAGTTAQPKTDFIIQIWHEDSSSGTWVLLDNGSHTADYKVSVNETTGDITIVLDVAPSAYLGRIVLIG